MKLYETFPDAEFIIENYQFPPFRRDRNKKCVGKWFLLESNCLIKNYNTLKLNLQKQSA